MDSYPHSVVFFGAHPDDETVMLGGTLAMLHALGVPAHVVVATDGRGGGTSDVPGVDSPEALAQFRVGELDCAIEALGVTSLTRLGYIDPPMGPDYNLAGFDADEDTLVAQIAAQIRALGADVVLTHGSSGEYGHPAHVQMHGAVLRAVREFHPDVVVYTGMAKIPGVEDSMENGSDPAHLVLDVSPWIDAKYAAMACHRTQFDSLTRRRGLTTIEEATRRIESFHRHWPAVAEPAPPDDVFASFLRSLGASVSA